MQPAFHRKQIEGYCDDMIAIAEHALADWRVGQELDIAHEMRQITLRVASKTLFGRDAGQDAEQIGRMIEHWMGMLLSSKIALFPFDLPGTPYRAALRHAERLEAAMQQVVAQKRAHPVEQHDVLAMLLAARDEDGDKLTDIELIGHTNGLFIAGHETTANALAWALFLLDQHPEVLRDLRNELHGTLRGGAPTVEQLGRLPLLEGVIKETMRLLPPLAFSGRTTTAECELGPYTLPAGKMVGFSPYITHHLPELYSEPERFRPERWRTITPSPFEYLPFGAGPHLCLGMSFAMTELKIVLSLIVQRHRLALRPNTRVDHQVRPTLAPRRGLPMVVAKPDAPHVRPAVRGNIHKSVDLHQ